MRLPTDRSVAVPRRSEVVRLALARVLPGRRRTGRSGLRVLLLGVGLARLFFLVRVGRLVAFVHVRDLPARQSAKRGQGVAIAAPGSGCCLR